MPFSLDERIKNKLGKLVPDIFEGTEQFLDICTWNIKFFTGTPERSELIARIMSEIKADIYVLQEIAEGSMDDVAERLKQLNAGSYKIVYGSSGGDIRVTFMYNLETVRATQDIKELFQNENIISDNGNPAFPRLPLHGTFQVRQGSTEPFNFELVGVHLKSQRNDSWEQRAKSAERLSKWILEEAVDEDVIITGDFNAPPDRKEWDSFRSLEEEGEIKFKNYNPHDEISHLYRRSGSRLDCVVVTDNVPIVDQKANVIRWEDILDCEQCQDLRNIIKDQISDHLPVIARFYTQDKDSN